MNQKGQEFSAFRLLIDAILVLLILVIIIGILGWVTSLRFQISEKRLYDGFDKAVNSPDGKTVVEKNIMLRKGSIYGAGAFEKPGVPKKCIKFQRLDLAALQLLGEQHIEIREDIQLDMYYSCIRNLEGRECSEECDLCCKISFGKEFA